MAEIAETKMDADANKPTKVALVVGGTGMASGDIAPLILNKYEEEFSDVIVISRSVNAESFKPKTARSHVSITSADLSDVESIVSALGDFGKRVTHLFWCMRVVADGNVTDFDPVSGRKKLETMLRHEQLVHGVLRLVPKSIRARLYSKVLHTSYKYSDEKMRYFPNTFDALTQAGAKIEHCTLITGASGYGLHVASMYEDYVTPLDEDMKRVPFNRFTYYIWEDMVRDKSVELGFAYNILRPSIIVGTKLNPHPHDHNTGLHIGAYICLLKAQGKPLVFPSSYRVWRAKTTLSASEEIARLALWAATTDNADAKNQALNVVSANFQWCDGTWKELAEHFNMEYEEPAPTCTGGKCVADVLGADAAKVWEELKGKTERGLSYAEVLNASFLDAIFCMLPDTDLSTAKLRRLGYPGLNTITPASQVIVRTIEEYVKLGFLPAFP